MSSASHHRSKICNKNYQLHKQKVITNLDKFSLNSFLQCISSLIELFLKTKIIIEILALLQSNCSYLQTFPFVTCSDRFQFKVLWSEHCLSSRDSLAGSSFSFDQLRTDNAGAVVDVPSSHVSSESDQSLNKI